jgi:hypothetical protein
MDAESVYNDNNVGDVKMAEEKEQVQAEEQAQVETAKSEVTEDKSKAEIAGLNRKIAELSKQLDAEKRAKMTEEEQTKADRAELEALKAETLKAKMTFELGRQLVKEKLPEELTDLVLNPPKSEDELSGYITRIKGLFKAHAANALEDFRKSNARSTPDTAGVAKVMTRSDFTRLTPSDRSKFMADGGQIKD